MTAMDERTLDEVAVTLAGDAAALAGEIGALTGAVAEWGAWQLAGGAPPKWVAYQVVAACRLIAAAARGEAVTL